MGELTRTIGAAVLWLTPLALFTMCANARRRRPAFDPAALLIAYPIFFLFQVLAVKALDLGGLLMGPAVAVVYLVAAAAALAAFVSWRGDGAGRVPDLDAADPDARLVRRLALASAGLVCIGLAAFALVVPVHVWDVQAYHMPMVANYMQNESIAGWPTQDLRQIFRVNAGELQMLSLALLSRSDAWMELPNVLGLSVCLVATFEMTKRILGRRVLGHLAVVLVLTAPQILYGSVSAKNDLVFTAVLLCSFYWVVHVATGVRETRQRDAAAGRAGRSSRDAAGAAVDGSPGATVSRWWGGTSASYPWHRSAILLIGAGPALAASTKVMGLNVLVAVGLALTALVLAKRVSVRDLALFGVVGLLVLSVAAGDIYARNIGRTTLPVGIRPGEVHFTFDLANFAAAARYYLYDLSFKRLVTPQIFEHDFSHYGYLFPLILTLGAVAGIRQLRSGRREAGLVILAFLAVVLFLSVNVARQPIGWDQRFMIWMVPVFAILAISLLRGVEGRILVAATSFVAAISIVNAAQLYANASEGLFTRSVMFTVQHGRLPGLVDLPPWKYSYKIDGFQALASAASPEDSILYVGAEDTWMYPAWGRRFTRHVHGVSGPEDAAVRAKSGMYGYIVVEDDAAADLRDPVCESAQMAGYRPLARSNGRTVLRRGANSRALPGRATDPETRKLCPDPDPR
jgi:hypothetical protein